MYIWRKHWILQNKYFNIFQWDKISGFYHALFLFDSHYVRQLYHNSNLWFQMDSYVFHIIFIVDFSCQTISSWYDNFTGRHEVRTPVQYVLRSDVWIAAFSLKVRKRQEVPHCYACMKGMKMGRNFGER